MVQSDTKVQSQRIDPAQTNQRDQSKTWLSHMIGRCSWCSDWLGHCIYNWLFPNFPTFRSSFQPVIRTVLRNGPPFMEESYSCPNPEEREATLTAVLLPPHLWLPLASGSWKNKIQSSLVTLLKLYCKVAHKALMTGTPSYVASTLSPYSHVRSLRSESSKFLKIPIPRNKLEANSFKFSPRTWNGLPP